MNDAVELFGAKYNFRPSSFQRRLLCRGSARAEAGMPDEKTQWSAEGDTLHKLDEKGPEAWGDLTPARRQLLERNQNLRLHFLKEQMVRLDIPHDTPCQIMKEHSMVFCDMDGFTPLEIEGVDQVQGTTDVIYWFEEQKVAIVFDSKFGMIAVPKAEMNYQLRCYSVMFGDDFPAEKIIAVITQPMLKGDEAFHAVEFSREELPESKQELIDIIHDGILPDAPRSASYAACLYCKAKANCAEATEIVAEIAALTIRGMDVDEVEDFYDTHYHLAEKVLTAMKNRIQYLCEHGLSKRYRLARKRTNRDIEETAKAFVILYQAGGILHEDLKVAAEEYQSVCECSRSQLELACYKNRGVTLDEMKLKIARVLGDMIVEKPQKRSIERIPDAEILKEATASE
jgi:hypothetical protein